VGNLIIPILLKHMRKVMQFYYQFKALMRSLLLLNCRRLVCLCSVYHSFTIAVLLGGGGGLNLVDMNFVVAEGVYWVFRLAQFFCWKAVG